MYTFSSQNIIFFACLLAFSFSQTCYAKQKPEHRNWKRETVQLHMGKDKITEIRYPQNEKPKRFHEHRKSRRTIKHKQLMRRKRMQRSDIIVEQAIAPGIVLANTIESPPLDGFVPYVAITATDRRKPELDVIAVSESSVVGNNLPDDAGTDYAIGIFDTGAAASVMGYWNAVLLGLFDGDPDYITDNFSQALGVTGSVDVYVSHPIGLFVQGIYAIDPNTGLLDTSGMLGMSNYSLAVGTGIEPDIPTAIGTPIFVNYTTVIENSRPLEFVEDTNVVSTPDVRVYEHDDANIPSYSQKIPLELRPSGSSNAAYVFNPLPDDPFDPEAYAPIAPTILNGYYPTQAIPFVSSVDLYEEGYSAIDKDRFMLDTGAQVTVIGSRIAARLNIDPNASEFEVDITGVTGETIQVPGFYLDRIEIPALGGWISWENVPVILLDVLSPESGTVDGIIGMNLFVDFDLVYKGGGLFLSEDPYLSFQPIALPGDISPLPNGDRIVNELDLALLGMHWLEDANDPPWEDSIDLIADDVINLLDYTVIASNWGRNNQP